MEIANAVMGGKIPMAILPGGTGNAMSYEFKVPRKLEQAAELLCQSSKIHNIDVARIGDQFFMLRAYSGIEESDKTSRENKDRFGNLAYILDALQGIKNPPHANYRLNIDGVEVEEEGLTCLILNAGSLGGVDLHATDRISASDGLLDVFIINTNLSGVQSLASYLLDVGKAQVGVHHWKGKEIIVEADPPQTSWIDGELFGPTPYTIGVIPKAVPIVVPE